MKNVGRAIVGALGLATVGGAGAAHAEDSFRLDRFRAAERADDGFGVKRLGGFSHLRPAANAVVDYAINPLQAGRVNPVSRELVLKVDAGLDLYERGFLFVGFDAPLIMDGDRSPVPGFDADGAGFGDVSLGARVSVLGDPEDWVALGAQATVMLPTGGRNFSGEPSVAARPELILELRGYGLTFSTNLGVVAKSGQSELVTGAALGYDIVDWLEVLGELNGGIWDPLPTNSGRHFGLEALGGLKAKSHYGLVLGAAGGGTLSSVIGTPDARVVVQLGYAPPLDRAPAPAEPPPAPADPCEGAGANAVRCPNGDADGDGVANANDACPEVAEDKDGDRDEDGCPDEALDTDGDGIADADDKCVDQREDVDGFDDEDGCPEPDNDLDGVPDAEDSCPDEAGPADTQGCPVEESATVTAEGEIAIREKILFDHGDREIHADSEPMLEAVVAKIREAGAKRVRIEGHTDSTGGDRVNAAISRRRARAVGSWLTANGVPRRALELVGCGSAVPIADNATEEGRALNRRVVFQIVDPPPQDPKRAQPPAGCVRTGR